MNGGLFILKIRQFLNWVLPMLETRHFSSYLSFCSYLNSINVKTVLTVHFLPCSSRLCFSAHFHQCTQNFWSSLMWEKWQIWFTMLWAACQQSCMGMSPFKLLNCRVLGKLLRVTCTLTQVRFLWAACRWGAQILCFVHRLAGAEGNSVPEEQFFKHCSG